VRRRVDLELVALRRAGRAEAAGRDAPLVAVAAVTLPGDNEVAVGIDRDRRGPLVVVGVGVDLELVAERSAGVVEAAGEGALAAARPGLLRPRAEGVAGVVHVHAGGELLAEGRVGGADGPAEGGTGRVVALEVHAVAAAVLPVALPRHDEVAIGIGGDGGVNLIVRRVAVDLEFRADR